MISPALFHAFTCWPLFNRGLLAALLGLSIAVVGCGHGRMFYVNGGPDIQAGIARVNATTLAPFDREASIARASATDIFVLRRYEQAYVLTRLGDTLNRIWTYMFPADEVNDLKIAALLPGEQTVTAVVARLGEDRDTMEYYAVTCDAHTGTLLRSRVIAHYEQSGSTNDPEYCNVSLSPDTSMVLLYRTDTRRLNHEGLLGFDSWACTAVCDTIFEQHMPIEISDAEKDNEIPVVAAATVDYNGRLLLLQCRADSTFKVIRIDQRHGTADSLTATASGFDFKDEDRVFVAPIMLIDSANRLHLLGVRRERHTTAYEGDPNIGTITLITAMRFDFTTDTAVPIVQQPITKSLAKIMSEDITLNSYTLHSAFLLPNGGYLCVVEQHFSSKGEKRFWHLGSRLPNVSRISNYEEYWDYGLVAFDTAGNSTWATHVPKRTPGVVRYVPNPKAYDPAHSSPHIPELWLVYADDDQIMTRTAIHLNDGTIAMADTLFSVNGAESGAGSPIVWLSDQKVVEIVTRARNFPYDKQRQIEATDQIKPYSLGRWVQAIVKLMLPQN